MLVLSIIVTYNGAKWIEKCLGSLAASTLETRILVIDNCSKDDTVLIIRQKFPRIEIIETGNNLGFGKANNIGLKIALEKKADYVFLLNQDAWIQLYTIENLVKFHKANEQFGIVSPIHLNGNGDCLDKNFSNCLHVNSLNGVKGLIENGTIFEETKFVNAASWLISYDCLNHIGGFDPLFHHYGEDRDYCQRTIFGGYKIGVLFNAFINHDRTYDLNNSFRNRQHLLYTSALAKLKNPQNKFWINYLKWSSQRMTRSVKYLLSFQFARLKIEINVLCHILKNYEKIRKSRLRCIDEMGLFLT